MMFSTNNTSPVVQVLNPCERLRHEFHHDPAVLALSELDVLLRPGDDMKSRAALP